MNIYARTTPRLCAVMSANCAEADKNRLLKSGASQYLVKPIKSESLAQLRRLVTSRVARDTQDSNLAPNHEKNAETTEQNTAASPEQAVLFSNLLEAASQAMSAIDTPVTGVEKPVAAKAAPADHSTGSDITGMEGPDTQGRTQSPSHQHTSTAQQHSDAADASRKCSASNNQPLMSPLQITGGASGGQLFDLAVMLPACISPATVEQVCVRHLLHCSLA
jgi:CheY-like chemotaxis protein